MTVYWGVKSRSKGTTSPAVLSKGVLDITSVLAKFRRRAATASIANREAPTPYRRRNQSCSKGEGARNAGREGVVPARQAFSPPLGTGGVARCLSHVSPAPEIETPPFRRIGRRPGPVYDAAGRPVSVYPVTIAAS